MSVSYEVLYLIACEYGWWDCDVTSCNNQCADKHSNWQLWCAEGSVESTAQVTAKDKFSCGVRCLVESDKIVG